MRFHPTLPLAILFALTPASLASQVIEGRVVEAGTGAPIAGALVEWEGSVSGSTLTDGRGRWRSADPAPSPLAVRVTHLGYSAREMPDVRSGMPVTIELSAEALPLDAVVVTASRRDQRLADVPVTTELVGRREIERTGVSDLSLVLIERAGIQLEGGHPAGEGVMLQGLGSERVLVLLDGQPMVGRISGQIDLSRIPTSMVERVEVLKGPQSSLYGSEAMGGVVNVITRPLADDPFALGVSLTGGSQGRLDASSTVRGSLGEVRYMLDAGRRLTELTPGQSGENGALAQRWDGMLKLGWSPSREWAVEAQGMLLDERQRWRSGALYNFSDNEQVGARLGTTWTSGVRRFGATAYLSQFDHLARRATAPEPVAGSGEVETQRLVEAELLYNTEFAGSALDLGIEGRREGTVSDRVVGHTRTLHSLEPFAQATWKAGILSLTPGARFAWSEEWGGHFTPRVALLVRPVPSLGLRAAVGRGYRAPAFKELYMEFLNVGDGYGYTVRGNENLRPETSTNITAGAEWSSGPVYLRTQLFHNRFDDFIETQLVGDSTGITIYSYGNIAEGHTQGVELEGGWVSGPFRIEGGYSRLDTEQSATGEALLGRAPHSGRISAESSITRFATASLTGVYTGRAPVQRTDDGIVHREGYFRLDGRVGFRLPAGIQAAVGARNLLDVQPELWPGYTGRHIYLALGWDLQSIRD